MMSWQSRQPPGWRIVHCDPCRDVYTLERTRRWFKGRYWVASGMELALLRHGITTVDEVLFVR